MLPAIVNANLARGAHQLSKKRAIVKRLDCVQNLGAMTVLCSDKTGTLTRDELSVHRYTGIMGEDSLGVIELAKAIPFDFERRRPGCIVRGITGNSLLIIKGAFDDVLSLCSFMRSRGKSEHLDHEVRRQLSRRATHMNKYGHRVMLVATRNLGKPRLVDSFELDTLEMGMTVEGMISFVDPPKDDAKDAVARLTGLGVRVKVLTGDSLPVALNVCSSLELIQRGDAIEEDEEAIAGPDLAALEGSDEFDLAVERCTVFTKVTPKQKSMIVTSLQKAGHCVGMLGDGINDAIALRDADVGISVDSGAGVAKDYGSILEFWQRLQHRGGERLATLYACPMMSIQLLAQNLLYDISQIAIPWGRVDDEYLKEPRRWNAIDIFRFVVVLGPTSSVIDVCTCLLGWFYYGVKSTSDKQAVQLFQTHWFR
ncbi:HAD-like domain-containing protein [Mariannaea sp. PMI_226]|nr:HAD-like domain-containing protein [Mariannaea sp. PMI_226]